MPRAFPDPQFNAQTPASLWGQALCNQVAAWLPQDPREISDEALAAFMADCKSCIKEARASEHKERQLLGARGFADRLNRSASDEHRRNAVQVQLLLVPVLRAARVLEQRRLAARRDPVYGHRHKHLQTTLCVARLHRPLLGAASVGCVRAQLGLPSQEAPPSAVVAAQGLIERHPQLFAPMPSNWRSTARPGDPVADSAPQRKALLTRILCAGILGPKETLLLRKCLATD